MDFSSVSWTEMAGLAGVAIRLVSYTALQAGRISGVGYAFPGLTILGSCLLLVSLSGAFNLSSALFHLAFILISVFGITRYWWLTRGLRFTAEEQALLATRMTHAPPLAARRLLDAGNWHDLPAGMQVARAGSELGKLVFLESGTARVSLNGETLAQLKAGSLIGEMTALHGGAATADVVVEQPGRAFVVEAEFLRAQAAASPEFGLFMEATLGRDVRAKLRALNNRRRQAGQIPA